MHAGPMHAADVRCFAAFDRPRSSRAGGFLLRDGPVLTTERIRNRGQIMADQITFDDFLKVDIRAGTILEAEVFPEARKPAYKMKIDFGPEIGVKKTSAQITEHYEPEALIGRQVMAVVNFPPRQIGPVMSEVLTLGAHDDAQKVVLLGLDHPVPNGSRMM